MITRVIIDRPNLVREIQERYLKPQPLLEVIGVAGMASMHRQLTTKLNMDDDVQRTGRLTGSLLPVKGGSGLDSVWNVGELKVEVGTKVPYAMQVNYGGEIRPKTVKMLAIPLTDKLRRSGLWPRDIDKARDKLLLIPRKDGQGAVLVDPTGELGYGKGPLFVLVRSVKQVGKHFANWDDQSQRNIDNAFGRWWTGKLG